MLIFTFLSIFLVKFSNGLIHDQNQATIFRSEIPLDSRNAEDLDIILKDVSDIYISGSPGFISAYGPESFPILSGQMGSTTGVYHPIAAAGRIGTGKVLGTAHDGFLIPEPQPVTSQRNQFLLNTIAWAAQNSTTPSVALIRNQQDSLTEFLLNNSIPTTQFYLNNITNVNQLTPFDVVIVKEFFNSSYAPILTEYTEQGGGLIMCLTSWAYYFFMDVPGHFGTNFPANMISTKAGFAWHGDAIADPTTTNGTYNASRALLQNTKVLESWEKIKEAINKGYPDDPENPLTQLSTVLEYGFEVIPPNDPFWTANYYAEAQNYTQTGGQPTPSQENPVKEDMDKFELQVFHSLSAFVLKPEDMPAHPGSLIFPGDAETNSTTKSSIEEISITYKKPSWFNEFERSAKNPWSYVPNSINNCHEEEEDSRSFNILNDTEIEVTNRLPLWFSTGLYARPGVPVTVTIQSNEDLSSWAIQIGSHTDDIARHPEWFRSPRISLKSNFVNNTLTTASPYGGLIYVLIPEKEISEDEKTVTISVSGSINAPQFRLGVTQKHEWKDKIRHFPGPWAEFVTNNVVLTVPSSQIRELEDPEDLLLFWDQAMDAIADLAAIPRERYRQERMVADIQISAGFMHSGYPIMTFLNEGKLAVNVTALRSEGSWGHFHELGHNHQISEWTFGGTGEVTCNLFALYVLNSVCGIPTGMTRREMTPEYYKETVANYIVGGLDFNKWKSEPFLALMFYVQLQRAYGWSSFKQVFADYRELPEAERPTNDQEKMDTWLVLFSLNVQKDLSSYFQSWGFPITDDARNSISFLPDSGISILDLLLD